MAPPPSTVLLDRPSPEARPSGSRPDRDRRPTGAVSVRPLAQGPLVPPAAPAVSGRCAPLLGALAALSVLGGYTWTGLIPSGGSGLSATAFSRGGALILGGLAAALGVAVLASGLSRRTAARTVLIAALALSMAATVVVEVVDTPLTRSILGAADLAMALGAGTVLVVVERRARSRSRRTVSAPGRGVRRTVPGN
jgi:hypothetical protein